mgnify:CR=1 FL=1
MGYWEERQAKAQERLTSKKVKEVEAQLKKYYSNSMKKVIGQFEQTYNKLLSSIDEGREPTPADLYKLDTYWQMQAQLKAVLQKLGDKQAKVFSEAFEMHFFEVYKMLEHKETTVKEICHREEAMEIITKCIRKYKEKYVKKEQ